jgi:hypothetical protein
VVHQGDGKSYCDGSLSHGRDEALKRSAKKRVIAFSSQPQYHQHNQENKKTYGTI